MAQQAPNVAVIFGGPSPEHDVSILTGLQAARALTAPRALYWAKTGDWYEVDASLEANAFVGGVPRGAVALRFTLAGEPGFATKGGGLSRSRHLDVEVAVVCCHGGPGEDGTLQAALDLAGIAYAGPTLPGASIGMDKLAFTAVMAGAGLPCLPRVVLEEGTGPIGFDGPYIVKPRFGGSSIGIDVVEDLATAKARLGANRHLRNGAVMEPYRPELFDLQVAVRSWPEMALSSIERPLRTPRGGGVAGGAASGPGGAGGGAGLSGEPEILGYADKYVGGEGMASAPRELPAKIDPALAGSLRDAALAVGRLAGVRGVARVDFLSNGTDLFVNEINTIPGSLARYLWIDPPVSFQQLLADMIAEARARPSHAYSSEGADGMILRGASSIAAKLA